MMKHFDSEFVGVCLDTGDARIGDEGRTVRVELLLQHLADNLRGYWRAVVERGLWVDMEAHRPVGQCLPSRRELRRRAPVPSNRDKLFGNEIAGDRLHSCSRYSGRRGSDAEAERVAGCDLSRSLRAAAEACAQDEQAKEVG